MYATNTQTKTLISDISVDNTIGGTPQPNGWTDDWVDFYRERRLKHQLRLLGDRRLSQLGDKLCDSLGDFFTDVQGSIKPSTLHGDLWSGNIASVDGAPSDSKKIVSQPSVRGPGSTNASVSTNPLPDSANARRRRECCAR